MVSGRRRAALAVAAAITVSGCGAASTAGDRPGLSTIDQPSTSSAVPGDDRSDLPPQWRWESYGQLEIGVPGDWGHGTTGRQWCARREAEKPFVGRPGSRTDLGCASEDEAGADPGTALATGGTFVWLEFASPVHETGPPRGSGTLAAPARAGDRETFVVSDVQVAIQAPAALRDEIRSTVRVVDRRNHHGCPVSPAFADDPGWRPDGPAVTDLAGVQAVSACRYGGRRLLSSVQVRGERAATAIEAVAAAPLGGGPNAPRGSCLPDEDLSTVEQIVLQVRSATGESEIVLRYGGCFHRGLDDGSTLRTLTRPAVAPFLVGGNRVTSFVGENLAPILWPPGRA